MTLPIVTIRPEPGCSATIAAGRELGLAITGFPMFEVRPLDWKVPDPASFDALLIGSANAFRHGGAGMKRLRSKPVFAVGPATAGAARDAGFAVEAVGRGMLQDLLDKLPLRPIRFLRVGGAELVPVSPPPGIFIETRAAYEVATLPMPSALGEMLAEGAVVMLHSAAAARHFSVECQRLDLSRASVHLAAIGPRVEAAAGPGWARVRSAGSPDDSTLLALASDMCHEMPLA